MSRQRSSPLRRAAWIAPLWNRAELPLYVAIAVTLLVTIVGSLGEIWTQYLIPWLTARTLLNVLEILDRLLLVSMLVEILQMVRISIGTRLRLASEPFLIVGLISVIRRVLIITAEGTRMMNEATLNQFAVLMIELAILCALVYVFVRGIHMLRQQRFEEMRRLREERRSKGDAPTWSELMQG
ncbi:MAG: hypothetical protein D6775_15095 [Caldilineae bacterium]|nr:MAG: hypothetical protein D6775_15095 [Caldilineae bacterium]